jgi:NodT family efflux transporter outer membrane factor (OMF) lipoprotein
MIKFRHLLFGITLVLSTLSCRVHQVRSDRSSPVEIPKQFTQQNEQEDRALGDGRWWLDFQDKELTSLIEQSLKKNLDLRRAWSRYAQAKALSRQAQSALWPQTSADMSTSRSRSAFNAGDFGFMSFTNNNYGMNLGAGYELDLWGKVRANVDAGQAQARASRFDLDTMAISLASQAAELWITHIELSAQKELLNRQLELNTTWLELVELRFNKGMATILDVFQQRQQVASIRAQIPGINANMELIQHELAVFLGHPPQKTLKIQRRDLPPVPRNTYTGIPVQILHRRPDIRAALQRVLAADHGVGVAIADRFPSLTLSASTGFRSISLTDLLSNWVWNLASSISAPILDGGRRSAEVDRRKEVLTEALLGYEHAILRALKETEDALTRVREHDRFLDEFELQFDAARATLREARARYLSGLNDYLPVLASLEKVQRLERQRLTALHHQLSLHIQLRRSLGGTWTSNLARNPDSTHPSDSSQQKNNEPRHE